MSALWAFCGGVIGGGLVGLWYERKLAELNSLIVASTNGLVAHHDEIVRGLIERIKQLEASR